MGLKKELVSSITVSLLPVLEEVSFAGNKCTETNIFDFVHEILQNAPNLLKLDLSDMDMHEKAMCNFSHVSATLIELNISSNKRIHSLKVLNDMVERCTNLKKLNISKINLNVTKTENFNYGHLSLNIEDFDISCNPDLGSVTFLNRVITRCQ